MPRVKYQAHINNPPKRNSVGRPLGFKDPRKIKPLLPTPNPVGRPPLGANYGKLYEQQLLKLQQQEKLDQALATFWQF